LVRELPADGGTELGALRRYQDCPRPEAGESASAGYRMRLLVLAVWQRWHKLRLYLHRPELGLDGTNNAIERAIGKSKARDRTMRGYQSLEGMLNGIALTQEIYRGGAALDLAPAIGA
jgi:hypothetical protein